MLAAKNIRRSKASRDQISTEDQPAAYGNRGDDVGLDKPLRVPRDALPRRLKPALHKHFGPLHPDLLLSAVMLDRYQPLDKRCC